MKHKSTKYKEDGSPRAYVLELRPDEIAAIYSVIGYIGSGDLQTALFGMDKQRLFDLVADIGNLGNIDFEDGWRDVIRPTVQHWVPFVASEMSDD